MAIELIGKVKQKNNGDFKLVDLADVDYDGTGKSAKQELENKIEEAKNSSTPYDDTEVKTDINNIKTDLGTEELTTTAKNIKAAINEHDSQIKDIANNQIPEQYLQASVDNYINNNHGGLASKTDVDILKNRQVIEFTPVNELPRNLDWNEKGYMWDSTGNMVQSSYANNTQALKTKLPVIEGYTYEFNRFQGNYFLYDKDGINGIQYSNTSSTPLKITIPKGICFIGINVDTSSMGLYRLTYFNRLTPTYDEEKNAFFTMPNLLIESEHRPLKGKKIVNLGDSIFGNTRPPHDISTKLAELTGATVYNCGFGGTNAGKHSSGVFDAFSLYRLADAITTKNWTLQDNNVNGEGVLNYYSETLNLLKSINFNTVDIITIEHGTNDFGNGLQPTGYKNTDISNRFKYYDGALSYAIETILSSFPHIRIFLITPHYRFVMNSNGSFDKDSNTWEIESWVGSGGNHTLIDFVNSGKAIAKEYQIPVIDNYFDLGINKFNRTQYFPSNDGTHHNQNGRNLIAEHIAKKIW